MSRTGHIISILFLTLVAGCVDGGPDLIAPESRASLDTNTSVQPLACPVETTRFAGRTIGPLGGTLSLDGHRITLLPGAVLRPTRFALIVPASPHVEVEIHAMGKDSFDFLVPARITISYDRCERNDIDAESLRVWHVNRLTGDLLDLMGGMVDTDSRSITFSSGHLSGFIIAN